MFEEIGLSKSVELSFGFRSLRRQALHHYALQLTGMILSRLQMDAYFWQHLDEIQAHAVAAPRGRECWSCLLY